jgi:hypothetical protein
MLAQPKEWIVLLEGCASLGHEAGKTQGGSCLQTRGADNHYQGANNHY